MSKAAPPRVAQIGCGYWGKNLARDFAKLDALAAVADSNPQTAAEHSHGRPVMTFDAILADPTIDAVALASPAVTHASLARQAIHAGKHVFVEKPLALTLIDAEAVIACGRCGWARADGGSSDALSSPLPGIAPGGCRRPAWTAAADFFD